jgi:glycosyltransferase involved in cell wall biosynthesis
MSVPADPHAAPRRGLPPSARIGLLWSSFGPYHYARASALQELARPVRVFPIQLGSESTIYGWSRAPGACAGLETLFPGRAAESLPAARIFLRARRCFRRLAIDVCFLPSYAPAGSFAAFAAAKSLGLRTVMMNESHAGTAHAQGWRLSLKRLLVRGFDAALVGGAPQVRYFASLGIPAEKIFTGYDCVDNAYFGSQSARWRQEAQAARGRYALPDHYFLSLGRLVKKKNLGALMRAYGAFLARRPQAQQHLVIVGSGEEGDRLRHEAASQGLPVHERRDAPYPSAPPHAAGPGVHFYGSRTVEENPIFYALADAFVLPSLYEEWGLVVNEAMACGLPVIVSKTAGCAEDLVVPGTNGLLFDPSNEAGLASCLERLADHPPTRSVMGRNSLERVRLWDCGNFARNALQAVGAVLGQTSVVA